MTRAQKNNNATRGTRPPGRTAIRRTSKTRLFVFGTMLAGEEKHDMLTGARFIGPAKTIATFQLRGIDGYPQLSTGGEQAVLGEVYEVDRKTLGAIDRYENRLPVQRRTSIALDDGTRADAYLTPLEWVDHRDIIVSGSWRAEQHAYGPSLTVQLSVSERDVRAALEAALTHRVLHWATVVSFHVRPEAPSSSALPDDVPFLLELVEKGTGRNIALRDEWANALARLGSQHKREFVRLLRGSHKAIAGDALIQLAAFGEIHYPLYGA